MHVDESDGGSGCEVGGVGHVRDGEGDGNMVPSSEKLTNNAKSAGNIYCKSLCNGTSFGQKSAGSNLDTNLAVGLLLPLHHEDTTELHGLEMRKLEKEILPDFNTYSRPGKSTPSCQISESPPTYSCTRRGAPSPPPPPPYSPGTATTPSQWLGSGMSGLEQWQGSTGPRMDSRGTSCRLRSTTGTPTLPGGDLSDLRHHQVRAAEELEPGPGHHHHHHLWGDQGRADAKHCVWAQGHGDHRQGGLGDVLGGEGGPPLALRGLWECKGLPLAADGGLGRSSSSQIAEPARIKKSRISEEKRTYEENLKVEEESVRKKEEENVKNSSFKMQAPRPLDYKNIYETFEPAYLATGVEFVAVERTGNLATVSSVASPPSPPGLTPSGRASSSSGASSQTQSGRRKLIPPVNSNGTLCAPHGHGCRTADFNFKKEDDSTVVGCKYETKGGRNLCGKLRTAGGSTKHLA